MSRRLEILLVIAALFVGFLLWLLLVASAHAGSTMQRDFPTTRFYTPNGSSAGSATTYGNSTKFYGPDGRLIGSITTNSGRTHK